MFLHVLCECLMLLCKISVCHQTRLSEVLEIMIQNTFHLNMLRFSHSYISYFPEQLLELGKPRLVLRHGRKLQVVIRHLTYISATLLFYFPSFSTRSSFTHLISWSLLFCCSVLPCIHLCFLHLLTCPPFHQTLPPSLSLILPGGEHNLINHCWMRRPLLSGSR